MGEEVVPGGEEGGVGGEVVVADGAEARGFEGFEAAVEAFAEEVFPGAFEFVGEAHDDSGHGGSPSKGLRIQMIRLIVNIGRGVGAVSALVGDLTPDINRTGMPEASREESGAALWAKPSGPAPAC